jgi:hypothetical protein
MVLDDAGQCIKRHATMSQSDDEATEEPCVHLGFLEPADPRSLLRHRFPSKLGGRPVSISIPPPRPALPRPAPPPSPAATHV